MGQFCPHTQCFFEYRIHYPPLLWVSSSWASLTVRITVKNGNPPGTGKIWENRFFTGKMDHHGAKCTQIGAQTCQGTSRTCQNFFTFTFKAAGVTFLKVILHLLQKVLNRQIWISLAVVSYLSPPVFLRSSITTVALSVIAWKILVQNKRDFDQN